VTLPSCDWPLLNYAHWHHRLHRDRRINGGNTGVPILLESLYIEADSISATAPPSLNMLWSPVAGFQMPGSHDGNLEDIACALPLESNKSLADPH
jgi:hypothetical protein